MSRLIVNFTRLYQILGLARYMPPIFKSGSVTDNCITEEQNGAPTKAQRRKSTGGKSWNTNRH